jgi:hypothetical protein
MDVLDSYELYVLIVLLKSIGTEPEPFQKNINMYIIDFILSF